MSLERLGYPKPNIDQDGGELEGEFHNIVKVDLPIMKKQTQMQGDRQSSHGYGSTVIPQKRDFHGVIDSCSHEGRAYGRERWLRRQRINIEANFKYQNKVEGQRLRNFVRSMLKGFSSRQPTMGDFGSMQNCSTKIGSTQYCTFSTQMSKQRK